ncbi:MAG: glycosyltransferase family 4 protein [Armatimonadota bacterium]|jgi:glycosyltransferase involved in cell wall biosynthesis
MSATPSEDDRLHVGIDCLVVADRPSGVERAVVGLVEGLAEVEPPDQRFSLMIAEGRGDALPSAGHLAPLWAPRWAARRAGRVLYEQTCAAWRMGAEGVDVVHGAAYVLPLHWGGPSVVTIHDAITVCHPQWCQWHNVIHYGLVMTRSARQAGAVVVPSEFTRHEVIEHVGVEPRRVHVVPLGVGDEFARADDEAIERVRERHDLPERYLLCVGNIEPRKNLTAVVAAFGLLAERVPHGLVVAGKLGWKCGGICAEMGRSRSADRIRRLDWVPSEDLPALYSGADLLIQWSLHEGFGLTPLEAMACGTPVVVSDGGALPEVAGEAARVVPLGAGSSGLAEVLAELLEAPEVLAEMSLLGIEHAAQYTWAVHAGGLAEIYREVAGAEE